LAPQVLTLDEGNASSRAAARRLKPIVEERREKMKEEMLGLTPALTSLRREILDRAMSAIFWRPCSLSVPASLTRVWIPDRCLPWADT